MEYIVTGTRAYVPVTPDSDLDIVLISGDAMDLASLLLKHRIKTYQTEAQQEYKDLGGYYFDLLGIRINIIVAHDNIAFEEWKKKTERMQEFLPIENRKERIAFFSEDDDDIPFSEEVLKDIDDDDIPF